MPTEPLIDPHLAFRLTVILSWLLILMGVGKVAVYLVGEFLPQAYSKVGSAGLKRFLTGTGNRLVFGLLGALTLLLGVVFLGFAYLARDLFIRSGLG